MLIFFLLCDPGNSETVSERGRVQKNRISCIRFWTGRRQDYARETEGKGTRKSELGNSHSFF